MKFEDRIQLRLSDLTEELFENIVAYGFHAPSGMGGPGCVIMIAEDGRSYQFYGLDLNKLNYHREWVSLFPVLNQCDTRNGSYYVLEEGEADWNRYLERIEEKNWYVDFSDIQMICYKLTESGIWSHEHINPLYLEVEFPTYIRR